MRRIFVGDLHGCMAELQELLHDQINLTDDDELYFVGDLVDRGPDSIGVLRYVRDELQKRRGACVMGNHEEKALKRYEKMRKIQGQDIHPQDLDYTCKSYDWYTKTQFSDWDYLKTLPLIHRIPEINVVIVHGGFYPRFFEHYPDGIGEIRNDWRTASGKRWNRMRRFTKVRSIGENGGMLHIDEIKPTDPHWTDLYDGREGFAIFGHDVQLKTQKPLIALHAIGLDTGCVFGGKLTALVLEKDQKPQEGRFYSVDAHECYWTPHWRYSL